jgi:AraC-like DNA-binding protein
MSDTTGPGACPVPPNALCCGGHDNTLDRLPRSGRLCLVGQLLAEFRQKMMLSPPDPTSYAWDELRRLCQQLTAAVPSVPVLGYRARFHSLHPFRVGPNWRVNPHVHSFHEFHLLLRGVGEDQLHPGVRLEAGTVYYHAPQVAHAWGAPEGPVLLLGGWFTLEPEAAISLPTCWPCWPDLIWDAGLLLAEAKQQAPGWRERAGQRVALVLTRVLATAIPQPPTAEAVHSTLSLLEILDRFIQDNLACPLLAGDLAAHAGMSERTLRRYLHAATGTTIADYILKWRMERAAFLLNTTPLKIADVGRQVGCPNAAHFTRSFRAYYRTTPQRYRAIGHE